MRAMAAITKVFGTSALVVATVATLTGCGGGGADGAQVASVSDGTSSVSPSAGDDMARYKPLVECLREHGFDVKDPDPNDEHGIVSMADGSGLPINDPGFKACESKWPADEDTGPLWTAEEIGLLKQYAACMREHGASDYPDPDPETGEQPADSTYNSKLDPKAEKAQEACYKLYPQSANDGVAG